MGGGKNSARVYHHPGADSSRIRRIRMNRDGPHVVRRYEVDQRTTAHRSAGPPAPEFGDHANVTSKFPSVVVLAMSQFAVPVTFTPNLISTLSGLVLFTSSRTYWAAPRTD